MQRMRLDGELHVDAALIGDAYDPSGPVVLHIRDGRIDGIVEAVPTNGPRRLAMPALVDAHNHARPLSSTSFGCGGKPLEQWLPHLAVMPGVDAYTAAAASFARSARGGATAVMVHMTRAMGLKPLAEEARDIARAAGDVGVSIGFAVSLRDRNPLVYGDHDRLLQGMDETTASLAREVWLKPLPSIDAQLAQIDQVADALADQPHVDVQYGPTGVQWCSDEMLNAVADASARTGRRVHMHMLETKPQRDWLDRTYDDLVGYLASIGLLSERLTLAHCVWARPDELRIIADHGARIAVNTSSNLHLFSGRAPVAEMLAAGVELAMGLDGCALDEDDDGLRELRLFHLLGHAPGLEPETVSQSSALRSACRTGRAGLGLGDGGVIAEGMPADFLLLDLDALDRDGLLPVDPRDLLFARATAAHISEVWSRGRCICRNGEVLGLDLPATEDRLRAAYRDALPGTAPLRQAWPRIETAIGAHYKGCC